MMNAVSFLILITVRRIKILLRASPLNNITRKIRKSYFALDSRRMKLTDLSIVYLASTTKARISFFA